MTKKDQTSWPLGRLPKEWQRPELDQLRAAGYEWDDPRDAVTLFENKIAEYAGSKYAIAVDSCTDAIMLGLEYYKHVGLLTGNETLYFPSHCYVSVPMVAMRSGFKVRFVNMIWWGSYRILSTNIYDSAGRFTRGMHANWDEESIQCLSFQLKKRLPIGKGGMILTNGKQAANWLRLASFEGRDLSVDQWNDKYTVCGWNCYMTPEDAARGILLFDQLPDINEDTQDYTMYPDLSEQEIFKDE